METAPATSRDSRSRGDVASTAFGSMASGRNAAEDSLAAASPAVGRGELARRGRESVWNIFEIVSRVVRETTRCFRDAVDNELVSWRESRE